jgi:hypothetical protein
MKPTADNPFPPYPGAKVALADYVAPDVDIHASLTFIERARLKAEAARVRIHQVMVTLSTDAHGKPREPSFNEREAIEGLQSVLDLLR